jgi:multidrug efflux pump subunit AcrB
MPLVPNNAMVHEAKNFGSIPIKPGRNVYLRDVAKIADATDINYGYALVDGRKSIYVPIIKKSTASTLTVVSNIQKAMPVFKGVLPEDVAAGPGLGVECARCSVRRGDYAAVHRHDAQH